MSLDAAVQMVKNYPALKNGAKISNPEMVDAMAYKRMKPHGYWGKFTDYYSIK